MLALYGFGPAFNLPDPSPFVAKVDLYCRINSIAFKSSNDVSNLRKAPKGKLPFIEDDGEIIADSTFIIEHLQKKHNITLDSWLNKQQQAQAYLIGKSLDENFYWCIVHSRWVKEDTWPLLKETFFGDIPFPMNKLVPAMVRRQIKNKIKQQGFGRHSGDEILAIADKTLHSLSILLGDNNYILGAQPCTLDCNVFAMTSSLILSSIDNSLNQTAKKYQNLVDYCQRISQQYY